MYKELVFRLEGMSPLVMHNVRLSDPRCELVKAIKKITGKKKKTEDDIIAISDLEWEGGLYLDEKERPCIPARNVEAMLAAAAAQNRMGKVFKSSIYCDGVFPVEYDGPKSIEKLREDNAFRLSRMMTVQQKKVLRTRPIFQKWAVVVTVNYNPEIVNRDQVVDAMSAAGKIIGLLEDRPRCGRFESKVVSG